MKRTERSPLGYYTIGIAALFLAGFFLLVTYGALTYRNTVRSQSANYRTRTLVSYLTTSLADNNTAGRAGVTESPEYGTVLTVDDGDSGYAFRIYVRDGRLLEDYAAADAPLNPDGAQVIGETASFSALRLSDSLIEVRTDAGRALLGARGGEGR